MKVLFGDKKQKFLHSPSHSDSKKNLKLLLYDNERNFVDEVFLANKLLVAL